VARSILIVGAGLGGLALAVRLAHRGHRVRVLEKTDQAGGRNRSVTVNGCGFDAGPTLVMMLDPFRRLFGDVGERMEDHLELTLCEPSYRVFYRDGTRLDATSQRREMAQRILRMSGMREAEAFAHLMLDLEALYRDAIPNFVERNYRSPLDLARLDSLATVLKHRMLGNLGGRIERTFEDPRLRMLFSFQTMYLGLSPYDAPWVYATLAYMEFGEGIWYPKGGVAEISRALARLAEAKGAQICLGEEVVRMDGRGVELAGGARLEADAVVCNADLPYARRELLGRRERPRRASCSAYMMYIDYSGRLPQLQHHNVFFGGDFRGNLEAIFDRWQLPWDPAFYAAVSARTDPEKAPPGHENLYLLVPCPNLERPWSAEDGQFLRNQAFGRLQEEVGFEPDRVAAVETFTPEDWQSVLNLDRGAAFGLSHHFLQSAAFRPANYDRRSGVYFVGASTVPGNGMPMVLISAELVERRVVGL
jgi:phytoene desaturase